MAVEGLDAGQQLAVVPDRDQHLRVAPHRRLQDRERPRAELVLLEQGDLVLSVVGCVSRARAGGDAARRWAVVSWVLALGLALGFGVEDWGFC